MNILVTGLMGSGKSTQAKLLAEYLSLVFLTTGDVLREIAKKNSTIGRKVKEGLDQGIMIDDKIVADIIKKRLDKEDAKKGFVSDSYPRHLKQLRFFDPKLDLIFYLKLKPEVAKKRLLERGREDDTKKLIEFRHKTQGDKIKKLVDFYKDKIKVIEINAEKSIEEVQSKIKSYLKEKV